MLAINHGAELLFVLIFFVLIVVAGSLLVRGTLRFAAKTYAQEISKQPVTKE